VIRLTAVKTCIHTIVSLGKQTNGWKFGPRAWGVNKDKEELGEAVSTWFGGDKKRIVTRKEGFSQGVDEMLYFNLVRKGHPSTRGVRLRKSESMGGVALQNRNGSKISRTKRRAGVLLRKKGGENNGRRKVDIERGLTIKNKECLKGGERMKGKNGAY